VPVDETPWWKKQWVQGSAALGATIVVVGIVLYATRVQTVSLPGGISSSGGGAAR
jgi:uncharacterized membrane protein YkgB